MTVCKKTASQTEADWKSGFSSKVVFGFKQGVRNKQISCLNRKSYLNQTLFGPFFHFKIVKYCLNKKSCLNRMCLNQKTSVLSLIIWIILSGETFGNN